MIARFKQVVRSLLWRVLGPVPPALRANDDSLFHRIAWFVVGNGIEGDFVELGSFRGASLIAAHRALADVVAVATSDDIVQQGHTTPEDREAILRRWRRMRFFAFDSFQGLPRTAAEDVPRHFDQGRYACSEADFVHNVTAAGLSRDRLVVVPGWFDRTCTDECRRRLGLGQAAVVHIDCDLYESTVHALALVSLVLQPGTVIVFDDWLHFRGDPAAGEQRAFREWSDTLDRWHFVPFRDEGAFRTSFIAAPRAGGLDS
jgi:hypothetical protein